MLTVWQCWPSLGYKQRAVPSRKDIAVDGATTSGLPNETVTVADVRAVPLEQLSADDDARHNAARVLDILSEPSHVQITSFQSAI